MKRRILIVISVVIIVLTIIFIVYKLLINEKDAIDVQQVNRDDIINQNENIKDFKQNNNESGKNIYAEITYISDKYINKLEKNNISNEIDSGYHIVIAQELETNDLYSFAIYSSTTLICEKKDINLDNLKLGDRIAFTYTGNPYMSSPIQVQHVSKIEVLEK